ncbi:hypothetical protein ACHAXT_005705 [Thalassiosira profunda]
MGGGTWRSPASVLGLAALLWSSTMVSCRPLLSRALPCWLALAALPAARAFSPGRAALSRRSSRLGPLLGIAEWRARISQPPAIGFSDTTASNTQSAPLLLLPFAPGDIILPGQSTTLKFKHGRYMDLIDESLTEYDSVIGLSLMDEDGMQPYVVICEIIEEELDIQMGYRGFSSMEVGVRAVGRATRAAGDQTLAREAVPGKNDTAFHGRKALCTINTGLFSELQDDPLTRERFIAASRHLAGIKRMLGISSLRRTGDDDFYAGIILSSESDERIRQLFLDAYRATRRTLRTGVQNDAKVSRQHRQEHLAVAGWAVLAAVEGTSRPPSIVMQALETKDTAERLRLGLAALLEGRDFASPGGAIKEQAANDAFQ